MEREWVVKLYEVSLGRVGRTGALALVAVVLSAGSAVAAGGGTTPGGGASPGGSSARSSQSSSGGASMSGRHASRASSPFGARTLRQGMRGGQVSLLQFYLDVAGYRTAVDGYFGPGTTRSVMNFQRSWGLRPSGVVRQADGRALGGKVQQIDSARPNGRTHINANGTATPPPNAPPVVRWIVASANRIINTSYCYAGGHGSWKSSCYDCSGSVSYALHGGYLLSSPEDSTQLESYGDPGKGRWVTIYADSSHTFIVVGGRAFDTANFGGPNRPAGTGPRWRSDPTGNLADGGQYVVRHPPGL